MAAKAKPVDWAAAEIDYRAGVMTDRAIGAKYKISHVAVLKRAKAEGWDRDLSARIKARTEAKVTKAAVTSKVTAERKVTERVAVEANATLQSDVILKHRRDIQALRTAVAAMSGELGALTNTDLQEALELVLDEKMKEVDSEKRRAAMAKAYEGAMALGSRAGAGQKLAAALGVLIEKERQAFGIDKGGEGNLSLGEFLNQP